MKNSQKKSPVDMETSNGMTRRARPSVPKPRRLRPDNICGAQRGVDKEGQSVHRATKPPTCAHHPMPPLEGRQCGVQLPVGTIRASESIHRGKGSIRYLAVGKPCSRWSVPAMTPLNFSSSSGWPFAADIALDMSHSSSTGDCEHGLLDLSDGKMPNLFEVDVRQVRHFVRDHHGINDCWAID